MLKYVVIGALLVSGCRTLSNSSESKGLLQDGERVLLEKMTIDVSKGEVISLTVDNTSNKPQPNAKFFIEAISISIEQPDEADVICSRPLVSVSTRGDQGITVLETADHDNEAGLWIMGKSLDRKPLAFNDILFTFEKGSKKKWSNQCRIGVVADGFWSVEGNAGYDVVSDDPKRDAAVREYSANFEHRLSHYMWHTSRGAWPDLHRRLYNLKGISEDDAAKNPGAAEKAVAKNPLSEDQLAQVAVLEKSIEQYKASGWAPPRYFQATAKKTAEFGVGEDFLFMHRQMIKRVTAYLKERNLTMIPGWKTVPKPDDTQFTLGPKGHDPIEGIKSDEYYYTTLLFWEKVYKTKVLDSKTRDELVKTFRDGRKKTNPTTTPTLAEASAEIKLLLEPETDYAFKGLKGISLSQFGHMLEMTLHNDLHARFAYLNSGARPNAADPLDRTTWKKDWSVAFDSSNYDSLNDTFASHVHPWFYRIHGWVDDRINDWLAANDYKSIGTKDECSQAVQPCYIWLSDSRYLGADGKTLVDREPWEGPMIPEEKGSTGQMSLHAHKAPAFTPDVVQATKGFRAPYSMMNSSYIKPNKK